MDDHDILQLRKDFPFFKHNAGIVYLDSAATALKPAPVIEALNTYMKHESVNIKRGVYQMASSVTQKYERAREIVAKFIGGAPEETVFVRNATEGINLIMYSLATELIGEGDEVVTTIVEHHSNFVPWQQLVAGRGGQMRIVDVDEQTRTLAIYDEDGAISLEGILSSRTKILAITHVSNVLGTIMPIKEIIQAARRINPQVVVVVDGAQGVTSQKVDVESLDCDFYVFSGHKLYGPTGIGVVWGKRKHWEAMKPFLYGGDMIHSVAIEKTTFASMPEKFEAGTPAIAEAIGLGVAVEYLNKLPRDKIRAHTMQLVALAQTSLQAHPRFHVQSMTDVSVNSGVVTLTHERAHAHDIASLLDDEHVLVRAGHHCAMPLHTRLGLSSTARLSFGLYTTLSDIERSVLALAKVDAIFA